MANISPFARPRSGRRRIPPRRIKRSRLSKTLLKAYRTFRRKSTKSKSSRHFIKRTRAITARRLVQLIHTKVDAGTMKGPHPEMRHSRVPMRNLNSWQKLLNMCSGLHASNRRSCSLPRQVTSYKRSSVTYKFIRLVSSNKRFTNHSSKTTPALSKKGRVRTANACRIPPGLGGIKRHYKDSELFRRFAYKVGFTPLSRGSDQTKVCVFPPGYTSHEGLEEEDPLQNRADSDLDPLELDIYARFLKEASAYGTRRKTSHP